MSYNITHWTTVQIADLSISMQELGGRNVSDYPLRWGKDNALTLELAEDGGLSGQVRDNIFYVTSVSVRGEGSGWAFSYLTALLEHSLGTLTAILIWEGGDSLSLLEVHDGRVERTSFGLLALAPFVEGIKAQAVAQP